jgi:hypothetical protein
MSSTPALVEFRRLTALHEELLDRLETINCTTLRQETLQRLRYIWDKLPELETKLIENGDMSTVDMQAEWRRQRWHLLDVIQQNERKQLEDDRCGQYEKK